MIVHFESIDPTQIPVGDSVEVVDNLTTDDGNKALSARQGMLIDLNTPHIRNTEIVPSPTDGKLGDIAIGVEDKIFIKGVTPTPNGGDAYSWKQVYPQASDAQLFDSNHNFKGNETGFSNLVNGGNNIALGNNSLKDTANGNYNIGIGTDSLKSNRNGLGNIGIGDSALNANTDGSGNIAIGRTALNKVTTGSNNIAIGNAADVFSATDSNQLIISSDSQKEFLRADGNSKELTSFGRHVALMYMVNGIPQPNTGNDGDFCLSSQTNSLGVLDYVLYVKVPSIGIGSTSTWMQIKFGS